MWTGSEAYTSKQCGMCGTLNDNLGASEVFKCPVACTPVGVDRDVHAARFAIPAVNILIFIGFVIPT